MARRRVPREPVLVRRHAGAAEGFFAGLWTLLRDNGVPFRLHWGKYQPAYRPGDHSWVEFFAAQYPRWDDFLRLREQRDPRGIFLTDYWRDRFRLWETERSAG